MKTMNNRTNSSNISSSYMKMISVFLIIPLFIIISNPLKAKLGNDINFGFGYSALISDQFWVENQYYGSVTPSFYISYRNKSIESGFEVFENEIYKKAYSNYSNFHYQPYFQYYILNNIDTYIKAGCFYSAEDKLLRYKTSGEVMSLAENGSWFGYVFAIGYSDYLVEQLGLSLKVEASFNDYLIIMKDNYYFRQSIGKSFYSLKISLVYCLPLN